MSNLAIAGGTRSSKDCDPASLIPELLCHIQITPSAKRTPQDLAADMLKALHDVRSRTTDVCAFDLTGDFARFDPTRTTVALTAGGIAQTVPADETNGWRRLVILGATGLREDHTLGNLGWLADFAAQAEVTLLTDTGVFSALHQPTTLASHPGQQVSLFTFDSQTVLHARGLRYPVENLRPTRWWHATLNEACGTEIFLQAAGGPVLVFQTHEPLVGRCALGDAPRRKRPDVRVHALLAHKRQQVAPTRGR
jgi:thiamine pyrophosphokinase